MCSTYLIADLKQNGVRGGGVHATQTPSTGATHANLLHTATERIGGGGARRGIARQRICIAGPAIISRWESPCP